MSQRFFQLQTEAAHGNRSSSPHRSSPHKSHSNSHSHSHAHHSSHRPQPQPHPTPNFQQRSSSDSSDSSDFSSSSSSSYGSPYYYDPTQQSNGTYTDPTSSYSPTYDSQPRYSMDASPAPRVEVMRCSRCAKCVETIVNTSRTGEDLRRVSSDEASASGMVRFGHNLYYCNRCARMVGYK